MLYKPEDFESLTDEPWDAERVRSAIRAIVADTDAAYGGDALWPADEWDGWQAAVPLKNLYVGAAGVIWALDGLRRRGHAETRIDLVDAAARTLAAWRMAPDFMADLELPSTPQSSLLCGESGILLVAWRLAPSGELADELFARVRENAHNEAIELMWGAPGTMLAARAMADWTGEQRWLDAWNESADALRAARDADGMWTYRLYGKERRSLGPAHGLVGNVLALGERDPVAAALLADAAVIESGMANWTWGDNEPRLQWCHGSPGIVDLGYRLSRREAAARRRGARLARGSARRGERARHLPRHRGQRLRVPEDLRAHRRRALARPRAPVRRARARRR